MKKIIKASGAIDYCQNYEEQLLEKSLKNLKNLTNNQKLIQKIKSLISFLLKRKL